MLKRTVIIVLASFCIFSPAALAAEELQVTAKSAIVIEASTGKVLYAKNVNERMYPASTTKMMTLIVALEKGKLDELVKTSRNASETEGSSLELADGESMRLLDLLYGMMLISGNDATVAVAEHIGGSVENFAKMMTDTAHAIGAVNTNFANSSGLPNPNHYTTAADLAKIAAYGYKNPIFARIVATEHIIIPWPGKDHDRDLYNENKMLRLYKGGNGVKTGYTDAAGPCLVSGAKQNDIQLVAVVLDSERMWDDSIKLLDYGFSQLKPMVLINEGDIFKTVRVNAGKTDNVRLVAKDKVVIPVSNGDADKFSTVIEAPQGINAPVAKGAQVGTVKVLYNNTEVASVALVADNSIERKSFFGKVWGAVQSFFSYIVKNIA
ncbi:MAG: dacB 1 [Firmicutes bacterium]|nr:dacB 1 [Bacillota bacterium]